MSANLHDAATQHRIRSFEREVKADLRRRRWLRVHIFLISMVTFGVCWGLSSLMLHAGVHDMVLRHGVALTLAYGVYLVLLRIWSCWLLSHDETDALELADAGLDFMPSPRHGVSGEVDSIGVDAADAADTVSQAASGLGDMLSVGAEADEAAVIVVPLMIVVGVIVLLAGAIGFAVFGVFGVDVLVGVAVEIAFASTGGALALKAQREGWLGHALKRTAAPMLAVIASVVISSWALGQWVPEAQTLMQGLRGLLH